jgi:hypothetical protein
LPAVAIIQEIDRSREQIFMPNNCTAQQFISLANELSFGQKIHNMDIATTRSS